MTSVFNKIHRLKRQPGWTWDRFLSEIEKRFPAGLDEKTLYNHYRQPHKKATSHITGIINQLHEQYFPDPFPEAINALIRLYNNLIKCKKHLSRDKDIPDLEHFLISQLNREKERDTLWFARLNWLLGNIQFDRIPTYRDNGQRQQLDTAKQRAIDYYQNSVTAIEEYNRQDPAQPVGASHLYKARHNILACYLNAVPQDLRSCDPAILQYLKESNYIPNSKQTLEAEPFQWSIARNGLRFSSLVKNANDVSHFFQALVSVNKRFIDLDYEPLNYGPISSGSDFEWAVNNVLTTPYLEQTAKTKKD
jgi:hypothetical protein